MCGASILARHKSPPQFAPTGHGEGLCGDRAARRGDQGEGYAGDESVELSANLAGEAVVGCHRRPVLRIVDWSIH